MLCFISCNRLFFFFFNNSVHNIQTGKEPSYESKLEKPMFTLMNTYVHEVRARKPPWMTGMKPEAWIAAEIDFEVPFPVSANAGKIYLMYIDTIVSHWIS